MKELHLHLGVHQTAGLHLWQQLHANRDVLAQEKVHLAPYEGSQNHLIKAARQTLRGHQKPNILRMLHRNTGFSGAANRMVLFAPGLLARHAHAFDHKAVYPGIQRGGGMLEWLLSNYQPSLSVCIRNPATFLASLYAFTNCQNGKTDPDEFFRGLAVENLAWSEVLHRLQAACPGLPITVWRFEDYPFMWRDVAQAVAGLPNKEVLAGTTANEHVGMSVIGSLIMTRYLQENPADTPAKLAKVVAEFKLQFPSEPDRDVNELWGENVARQVRFAYEDDWYYITRMEGVQALEPQVGGWDLAENPEPLVQPTEG